MTTYTSTSPQQTQEIAHQLAQKVKNGGVITLTGDLGAGKTTFVQGLAQALEVTDKIISPTFVLIRQHPLPNSQNYLYHIDLYRISSPQSLKTLGIEEVLEDPQNIVVIEWPENILDILPQDTFHITFEKISPEVRKIIAED